VQEDRQSCLLAYSTILNKFNIIFIVNNCSLFEFIFMKIFLLICGFMSLLVGFLGIFLPVVPTVPLLLLAAFCFSKSSDRFYSWLVNHRLLGGYIRDYRSGEGLTFKVKAKAILLLWVTIGISFYLVPLSIVRIILFLVATGVTYYLILLPTKGFKEEHLS